jgi:hypothetical protein
MSEMKHHWVSLVIGTVLLLSASMTAQSDLLPFVWHAVQEAQNTTINACGKVTETRTSKLMSRPMVLRGHFCASGRTHFMLEYTEPTPLRIRYNDGILNVTSGDHTEVMEVGGSVRRAQDSFSRENSLEGLKKSFTISVVEKKDYYELKLVPRSAAFARRLNYIIVKLQKSTALPRSLEIDGKNGVNSVFAIEFASTNTKLPASTFEVYKP